MARKNVLLMGAAGRDFHNFNTFYRDNKDYNVVAFTATQIPNIDGRIYPKQLAGKLYPKGIKIYEENDFEILIRKLKVDEVVFSYSDITFNYVMTKASIINAAGVSFRLLGAAETEVKSKKPESVNYELIPKSWPRRFSMLRGYIVKGLNLCCALNLVPACSPGLKGRGSAN